MYNLSFLSRTALESAKNNKGYNINILYCIIYQLKHKMQCCEIMFSDELLETWYVIYLVFFLSVVEWYTMPFTSFSISQVSHSLSLYLIQLLHSNWLLQVMWHKNYWWHHSMLSTRTNDSTSLVTSVKVSWLRRRTPKVRFEN